MNRDLNYTLLVEEVAAESGVSRETVNTVLRATFDVIGRTVVSGCKVAVTNFGTWFSKENPPRPVRNPQTGETWQAPARQRPRFRWSPAVQEAVRSGTFTTLKKRPSR
jgi:DNA-binding protein HU-beta